MNQSEDALRERLAALAHEQWSGWMNYMFQQTAPMLQAGRRCEVVPPDLVERWKRQRDTPYAELPENEKESDRIEADKVLKIIQEMKIGESVGEPCPGQPGDSPASLSAQRRRAADEPPRVSSF